MWKNGFSLRRRTLLCQKCQQTLRRSLLNFKQRVVELRKENSCLLNKTENANEILVYFDMLSSYIVVDAGADVMIKTSGFENVCVTVMLAVLAAGSKLPPFVIPNHKIMPKEQLLTEIIVRCQPKVWMTIELTKDW
jgi:hypothetical protein